MKTKSKYRGFTLIELMIVVAIIAIIAAIAYPSYRQSVIKSDRSDAIVSLTQAAQALERCYAQQHNYTAAVCPTFPQSSPNDYYTITLPTVSTVTYEIVAKPSAGSPQQDDETCAEFHLFHTGRQAAQSVGGTVTTDLCW